MSPHCDTIDGPVARAARKAIETVNVLHALPWVPAESEQEVRDAFEDVMHAREKHPDASAVADRWFLETVVRLHRAGEGASYEGLKPAVLDPGNAVRMAEVALESGDAEELEEFFEDETEQVIRGLLRRVRATAVDDPRDTAAMRRHLRAKLAFLDFAADFDRLLVRSKWHDSLREAVDTVKETFLRSQGERRSAPEMALSHH